jgi:RNA recognition motif-containing protein
VASKLYVGNLPYTATDDQLRELFSAHGTVESAKAMTDPDGRARGFGFVEMSTEEEAKAAEAALNGSDLDGRALKVNPAKPLTDRR